MDRTTTLPALPDEVTLTEITQLEALANPTRMRVLLEASQPTTVAAVADRLGMPKTRLYYHVNLLVEAGLLTQVDERKSGARIERIYRVAARNFRPGAGVWDQTSDRRRAADLAAGVLFEPARAETAAMIEQVFDGARPLAKFGRMLVHLTEEEAAEIGGQLADLIDNIRRDDNRPTPETTSYAFTYALAPTGEGDR